MGDSDPRGSGWRLLVFVLLVTAVTWAAFTAGLPWWAVPIPPVLVTAAFWLFWYLAWEKLPTWKVRWWVRKNDLPESPMEHWVRLSRRLRLNSVAYPDVAYEVFVVYRREMVRRLTEDRELAEITLALQTPEVAALGSDVRPLLLTMYKRARGGWSPSPELLRDLLTECGALRAEGFELDSIVAYLAVLRPKDAFAALRDGVPIEYASVYK